jgi:hypothetical protein
VLAKEGSVPPEIDDRQDDVDAEHQILGNAEPRKELLVELEEVIGGEICDSDSRNDEGRRVSDART